jgi:hypothetical protein
MARTLISLLISLVFLFPGNGTASEDLPGETVMGPSDSVPAPINETGPTVRSAAALERAASGGQARMPFGGNPESGQDAYEVDLGKVWNVSPAYFRKVFDGEGETEPSGLKEKIEQNLYGTIQTKWGPADLVLGSLARFFASSPVMLDREYNVRRTMLYE